MHVFQIGGGQECRVDRPGGRELLRLRTPEEEEVERGRARGEGGGESGEGRNGREGEGDEGLRLTQPLTPALSPEGRGRGARLTQPLTPALSPEGRGRRAQREPEHQGDRDAHEENGRSPSQAGEGEGCHRPGDDHHARAAGERDPAGESEEAERRVLQQRCADEGKGGEARQPDVAGLHRR